METFRKVEVNIPLLDAIKQVPRYAKFLKELCTSKKKLKGNETVKVNENVSTILQKRLPPKCKDPCFHYSLTVEKDRGSHSILADKSMVHPKGVLEDILVQVNELVLPVDFYVLDMEDGDTSDSSSILGTLSMEFDGEIINFNIYDAMRYPSDVSSVNWLDVIDPLTDDYFELSNHDTLALILNKSLDEATTKELAEKFKLEDELIELVSLMDTQPRYETTKL
ncbi:uncharacterized protein LOC143628580 [Bidens hawaiensis]|uniref:uncharacterized protein LOC143628580 n=1 Tax=Bidens hawaiensis TaxID=980011 RepID=UPI00404B1475